MHEIPTTVKNPELVERRREQIVLAAIKLFSRKGYHNTTLKDLAKEAGFSQGNIYGYVGSKEDIFFLIHDFLVNTFFDALNSTVDNIRDPVEKLRRIVRTEFNLMAKWADAILLIYQEGHILSRHLLKKLLEKERAHLALIEAVIQDAMEQGSCRPCNPRLTANLVKSMMDSWIIKRWDLRGHATQLETEKAILNALFDGLISTGEPRCPHPGETRDLEGKCALVINAGTPLGAAISSSLSSRGARVAAYTCPPDPDNAVTLTTAAESGDFQLCSSKGSGANNLKLLDNIEADFGPVDIYIQDLGIGNTGILTTETERGASGSRLDANLKLAQDLASDFQEKISKRASRRIIYVAPWAWDKYANPVRYETVRGAVIALTQVLAKTMVSWGTSINCIVPGFIGTVRPSDIQEDLVREAMSAIPGGRLGALSDITDAVFFLTGDASQYLSGQVLKCAGGAE
ncbi:MAG: SDR family oxidoreductase [Desulfomonilaceae bacterium]